VLLLEIRHIGIQVVFELFLYFKSQFSPGNVPKPSGGRAMRSSDFLAGFKGWVPAKGKEGRKRKEEREGR